MKIELNDDIWCSNELGVLDKIIIVESTRTNNKIVNDEFFGHISLFTRCKQDNVIRSINKLIDLNLLSGNKLSEIKRVANSRITVNDTKQIVNHNNACLDDFLKKYKEVIKKRHFEIAQEDSIILADDAMKLTISCFKSNKKKYEKFPSISDKNLIAIFEVAVKIKKKVPEYSFVENPFAYITNAINKCVN